MKSIKEDNRTKRRLTEFEYIKRTGHSKEYYRGYKDALKLQKQKILQMVEDFFEIPISELLEENSGESISSAEDLEQQKRSLKKQIEELK